MRVALAIAAILWSAPAAAEVVSSSPNGFHVRYKASLDVPPGTAFSAFTKVTSWWNPDHTYSGKASALSMQIAPGGCFCEKLPNGGIEHMRVTYVDPGKRLLLTGSLGPTLFEATTGAMDIKFDPQAGGSRVTMDYKLAGFAAGGADKLAPLVDKVLAEQWSRYEAFAARR